MYPTHAEWASAFGCGLIFRLFPNTADSVHAANDEKYDERHNEKIHDSREKCDVIQCGIPDGYGQEIQVSADK